MFGSTMRAQEHEGGVLKCNLQLVRAQKTPESTLPTRTLNI